jgi:hypothetical protein
MKYIWEEKEVTFKNPTRYKCDGLKYLFEWVDHETCFVFSIEEENEEQIVLLQDGVYSDERWLEYPYGWLVGIERAIMKVRPK